MVLCEDKQQRSFIRNFLLGIGFERRKIYFRMCPRGRQSGEQFVRENYPSKVRAYRGKKNHLSVCLAVVIDADTKTVDQRLQELDASLTADAQQVRQPDEKIAIFVPKRNIETWIHYLMGEKVDEETAYSKLQREGDCKHYVKDLTKRCHRDILHNAPYSFRIAYKELQRIKG